MVSLLLPSFVGIYGMISINWKRFLTVAVKTDKNMEKPLTELCKIVYDYSMIIVETFL